MGKLLKILGRELKLALKTVTFHWKQYVCFFFAILAVQVMFGVIAMSSSKNIEQYEQSVSSRYDYHFAMTNLPDEGAKKYFLDINKNAYNPYYVYEGETFVYVRIDPSNVEEEGGRTRSLEYYFEQFKNDYSAKLKSATIKPKDIDYVMSPLYTLDAKVTSMRFECAAKLIVLALVSIAVIILLLNIRLNHFKFTYGIYMSFGADTKKLFFNSFWDMLMIGFLTFLPAAIISIFASFFIFSLDTFAIGQFVQFLASHAPLMFFSLLFIIPVCVLAVFIPIKLTASNPPLKLLVAQDNSNLVSSPRISKQLIGKKFPRAYESLGLIRFRRYVATLVASSVLFASIFVWISFYADIYNFNTQQQQAEFEIAVDNKMEVVSEYVQDSNRVKDVTSEYERVRDSIYIDNFALPSNSAKVKAFEDFYSANYTINRVSSGKINTVKDSSGRDVTAYYWQARNAIVNENYRKGGTWENTEKFREFETYMTDGNHRGGTNNVSTKYFQKKDEVTGKIVKVYEKELRKTYKYPDNILAIQNSKEKELEGLVSQYTLLKNVNFELYQSEEAEKSGAMIRSNYVYAGFDKNNVVPFSGLPYNNKVEKRVTDNIDIYALDSNNLAFLQKYQLEILGDQDALFMSDLTKPGAPRYVIISETAANSQVLDIKPGDVIDLSYVTNVKKTYDASIRGDNLLAEMIKNDEFGEPVQFVVYAVIKDMPTSEDIPIYMLEKDYKQIIGVDPVPNSFSIYLPADASSAQIDDLYNNLVEWADGYAKVTWNNSVAENRDTIEMKNLPIIQTIAFFALFLSPLFWFFSQIMFYGKREEEFRMLRGLGAIESEIKKIFRKDGITFAIIGAISSAVLGILGVLVIHKVNMTYTAFFGAGALTLYRFKLPIIALLIAVVFTALCGYLSTVIPYKIDRKKAKRAIAKEFGEE